MPCYSPLEGHRATEVHPRTGKRAIRFGARDAYQDLPVTIPCGQCIGCRLDRSRAWAARLLHEQQTTPPAWFITLTYAPESMPPQLIKAHLHKFIRRARRHYAATTLRYYGVGEYGDELGRPHFHVLLYGAHFNDRTRWKTTPTGDTLYRSPTLEKLWPHGHALFSDVTFETAAYVARYALKKITGPKAAEHYQGKQPEFASMSLRPGIGGNWIKKYADEAAQNGTVICRGREIKNPRYYDDKLEKTHKAKVEKYKRERTRQLPPATERTPTRLATREEVARAQLQHRARRIH